MISVYENKQNCCGCGICSIACPKQAITMEKDAVGHVYPHIDPERCVDCGICRSVCAFEKKGLTEPQASYAGTNLDAGQRRLSTSAGAFSAIATAFLEQGGLVCGAAMDIVEGQAVVRHILIRSPEELPRLQGSKYVQSDFSACCHEVLQALREGARVLVSGTPCQIAGARSLFKKYPEQLYFVDIICHGVPSLRFFNDYLKDHQKRHKVRIEQFLFRDKAYGWGLNGTILEKNARQELVKRTLSPENSTYYHLFLQAETYRDSCYACPYACVERVGDITLGDYWGIDRLDPQLLTANGGAIDRNEGVSCLLVNTEKGSALLASASERLHCAPVEIAHVRQGNTQLNRPAKHSAIRSQIMEAYAAQGYGAVHKRVGRILRQQSIRLAVIGAIPRPVKTALKRILGK